MILRVALIDDEPLARDGLRMLLAAHPVEIVGEAGNGRDGLALLRATRPDLALVDVAMPELSGLDMAAALPDDLASAVVFVTAFDDHAVRAFELHALDYLVKPVTEARLARTLARARPQPDTAARLRAMRTAPTPLAIRDGQRVVYIALDDVDWIEAARYYVEIHSAGRCYLHRDSLQRLTELAPARFLRVHRSRVINRDRIREVQRRGRGAIVTLADGSAHPVARSYWASLSRALDSPST